MTSTSSESEATVQAFGNLIPVRIGLAESTRHHSVAGLNRLLAHTTALRDLYKKAHWQTSGATFYELHLLFDKHHDAQSELMDALAERVQTLGGVALVMPRDIAEETRLARARVTNPAQRDEAVRRAERHFGSIDVLVNKCRHRLPRGDRRTARERLSAALRSELLRGEPIEAYAATAGAFRSMMDHLVPEMFPGDPARAAAAIDAVVQSNEVQHWVILGSDAYRRIGAKLLQLLRPIRSTLKHFRAPIYPVKLHPHRRTSPNQRPALPNVPR
jgi:starvation-inducible DNA-binding protein